MKLNILIINEIQFWHDFSSKECQTLVDMLFVFFEEQSFLNWF